MTKANSFTKVELLIIFALAMLFVVLVINALIQPYFEMEAFNRHRNPNTPAATYWEAMFSNLRIEAKSD